MSERSFSIRSRRITLTPEQMRQTNDVCLLTRDIINNSEPSLAELPDDVYVEPSTTDPLSKQIAEPGGLHTCDMTSTVNAFIWQGWLTGSQGEDIHDKFHSFQLDREFTRRVINGMEVLVASREEHAIQAISGEKLYSGILPQANNSKETVTSKILGALSNNIVLNIGDGGHARLAVGYVRDSRDTKLWVSNPYYPNDLELQPIDSVVSFHPSNAILAVAKKPESLTYRPDIPF